MTDDPQGEIEIRVAAFESGEAEGYRRAIVDASEAARRDARLISKGTFGRLGSTEAIGEHISDAIAALRPSAGAGEIEDRPRRKYSSERVHSIDEVEMQAREMSGLKLQGDWFESHWAHEIALPDPLPETPFPALILKEWGEPAGGDGTGGRFWLAWVVPDAIGYRVTHNAWIRGPDEPNAKPLHPDDILHLVARVRALSAPAPGVQTEAPKLMVALRECQRLAADGYEATIEGSDLNTLFTSIHRVSAAAQMNNREWGADYEGIEGAVGRGAQEN